MDILEIWAQAYPLLAATFAAVYTILAVWVLYALRDGWRWLRRKCSKVTPLDGGSKE